MPRFEFFAYGIPKPQPRHRAFARKVGDRHITGTYDPKTAEEWKSIVVDEARKVRPEAPLDGPLIVTVDFYLKRPKRLMRRADPDGRVLAPCRPDRDNLEKALVDALAQDGWMRDDSQVVGGAVWKWYHAKTGRPGARVVIETFDEPMT